MVYIYFLAPFWGAEAMETGKIPGPQTILEHLQRILGSTLHSAGMKHQNPESSQPLTDGRAKRYHRSQVQWFFNDGEMLH